MPRTPFRFSDVPTLPQVHVSLVPLVSKDAEMVQQPYNWGGHRAREGSKGGGVGSVHTPGPFLTPAQYEAGDGEVATCTSSPMVTNDHYANLLPQVMRAMCGDDGQVVVKCGVDDGQVVVKCGVDDGQVVLKSMVS